MPTCLTVRPLTTAAAATLERLARSRPAPARAGERAQLIGRAHHGVRGPAIATQRGGCAATVRTWLRRCNADGLAGLADAPRSGRPATYPAEAVGALVAASRTDPQEVGLPFGSGTLDRLAA